MRIISIEFGEKCAEVLKYFRHFEYDLIIRITITFDILTQNQVLLFGELEASGGVFFEATTHFGDGTQIG